MIDLAPLRSSKPREIAQAVKALAGAWPAHRKQLLAALRSPRWNDRPRYVMAFGSPKQLIWRAILARPSRAILAELAFLARDPDPDVRQDFADDVAGILEPYALPLLTRLLADPEEWVRTFALCGIRDNLGKKATPAYRKALTRIVLAAQPRLGHDPGNLATVLEKLAPKVFKAQQAARRQDPIARAFMARRPTRKQLQILGLVIADAEIRNGGIDQYRRNSSWHGLDNAISGAHELGLPALAKVLEAIKGRYRKGAVKGPLATLERAFFRATRNQDMKDLIRPLVTRSSGG
jgi:hypothetical protein